MNFSRRETTKHQARVIAYGIERMSVMQPIEGIGQIFVIVIDETYGGAEETWEEDSDKYRIGLEKDFDVHFEEVNVGPGADMPAFLTIVATTTVPLWSLLLGAFFLGKPISENLDAWADIGRKLRSFFIKPVVLARHGASVIAIEAVFEEIGGMPKSVQLLSYRIGLMSDTDELTVISSSNKVCENVPTINLGLTRHIFEIEADGEKFRVSVDGTDTKVLRI